MPKDSKLALYNSIVFMIVYFFCRVVVNTYVLFGLLEVSLRVMLRKDSAMGCFISPISLPLSLFPPFVRNACARRYGCLR